MKIDSQLASTQLFRSNHRLSSDRSFVVPSPETNSNANTEAGDVTSIAQQENQPQNSVATTAASAEQQKLSQRRIEAQREQDIQAEVRQLSARDQEVRTHEQAHVAAGGQYAGSPVYEFKRGPDGISYAVGGEVSISVSRESTPEATIRKAEIIKRAALAPAEPSPQDRRVAAMAGQMEAQARAELVAQRRTEEAQKASETEDEPEQTDAAKDSNASGVAHPGQLASDKDFGSHSLNLQKNHINSYQTVSSSPANPPSVLSAIA